MAVGRAPGEEPRASRTAPCGSRSRRTRRSAAACATSTSSASARCCAYTLDGEGLGKLDCETFSRRRDGGHVPAAATRIPGFATGDDGQLDQGRGRLHRAAAQGRRSSPETTQRPRGLRSPQRHRRRPWTHHGQVHHPRLSHRGAGREGGAAARKLASETVDAWPGSSVDLRGPRAVPQHARGPRPHPAGRRAARARPSGGRALTPIESQIRGGTDGSILSEMGLPTPNLFTGQHNFHSRLEWISAQDMEKSARDRAGADQGLGGEGVDTGQASAYSCGRRRKTS